jgi:cytochrome c oxidase subunit II
MPVACFLLKAARVAFMPPDGSLYGPSVDHLMFWNLVALCVCVLAAHLVLVFAIFRQRSVAGSFSATFRWGLVAVFCAMYVWMALTAQRLWAANRFAGPSLTAMQVEVVGEQFQWYFRYPGADATFGVTRPELINAAAGNPLGLDSRDPHGADDVVSSTLVLPAGREVDLRLRSLDVIHGFFIPGMRLKQNTVPGLVLHIHFTPVVTGTYPILCSQICGLGHTRMQARLQVVSGEEFDEWIREHERVHTGESGQ